MAWSSGGCGVRVEVGVGVMSSLFIILTFFKLSFVLTKNCYTTLSGCYDHHLKLNRKIVFVERFEGKQSNTHLLMVCMVTPINPRHHTFIFSSSFWFT